MEFLKFYLFYIPILAVFTIVIIRYLNNKNNDQRLKVLIYLAALALLLHIIKPFFFPYNGIGVENEPDIFNRPAIFRKITFENVCAVSALLYLPTLLFKNKYVLDYMAIFGFIGGFLALLWPAEVMMGQFDSIKVNYEMGLFSFDTIRFYLVHYLLFLISFLLLYYRIHELDTKRMFYLPVSVLLLLTLLFVNEYVLFKLGWLDDIAKVTGLTGNDGMDLFLDVNKRNFSFVFGIPDAFKDAGFFIDILVPGFMKDPYIPVIWITIPVFVYAPLIYMGFKAMFEKITFKMDVLEEKEFEYTK